MSIARQTRYLWRRLLRMRGTPHAIALGFSVGAFVSFTPFVGFHFLIAAMISWVVGGNILASALGTFVGNPFTFPFIWWAVYQTGALMTGGGGLADLPPDLTLPAFWDYAKGNLWHVFLPMLIGSLPIGLASAPFFYIPVYSAVGAYQRKRGIRWE